MEREELCKIVFEAVGKQTLDECVDYLIAHGAVGSTDRSSGVYSNVRGVYEEALEKWGAEAQKLMCMEEMSELQKELCKNSRGARNIHNIAEEIADVSIMLEQMIILFDCERIVERQKAFKIERLSQRLNGGTQ